MDINELFANLQDGPSEDRTVHTRTTPYGLRTDFEEITRTSFEKAYPQTTKELRIGAPLPCQHHVTKENPLGGYCVCGADFCSRCQRICSRCSRSISSHCCAVLFENVFFCKPCRRFLRAKRAVSFLLAPFLADG
jgi:hypothetical protein